MFQRLVIQRYLFKSPQKVILPQQFMFCSKNEGNADRTVKIPDKKENEALKKLNDLLQKMIETDVPKSEIKLQLAKPAQKRKSKDVKRNDQSKAKAPKDRIRSAAQEISRGDAKIESELLQKLLVIGESQETPESSNLSEIVKTMKIDKDSKDEKSRAHQVRQILQNTRKRTPSQTIKWRPDMEQKPRHVKKIPLFTEEALGIFSADSNKYTEGLKNDAWDNLYKRELKLAVTHPPSNYFEQLILWTEQGKIWKFPIDNEQGLEDEQNVYFAEHIFLEKHLEDWCPPKGPLRHFMELVCVGLSKNPYLTVNAKVEHIEWFRNYFDNKKQLLTDVGALNPRAHKEIET